MDTKLPTVEIVVNGWIPENYKRMLFFLEFHVDTCTKLTDSKWLVTPRKSRNEEELVKNAEILKSQLIDLGYYVEIKETS